MKKFFESVQVNHLTFDGTNYALTGGTSDVNSGTVDARGFEKVAFLCVFGDNADTATFTGTIQGSADGSTGWTAITNAAVTFTAGATDTDNEMVGVECEVNPAYRYYRFATDRGTANTVGAALLAFLIKGDREPVTQPTGAGQFVATPIIVP